MTAFVQVSDLVNGVIVDESVVTLEPLSLPNFLRLPMPPGLDVGDEFYVTVKVSVKAILPG